MPIRLVLADDHPVVLQGLGQMFASYDGFQVLASCRNGNETLEAVRSHRPDVLVLDLRMPGLSGLDVLRAMSEEGIACRTVVLTAMVSDEETLEAVRLGATGLVLKESPPEVLVDCVRRVHQGLRWMAHEALEGAVERAVRREAGAKEVGSKLSAREFDVVRCVSEGLRNREIADRLCISEGTVKIHLHNIYEKLGVDGRLELVLYVREAGLI